MGVDWVRRAGGVWVEGRREGVGGAATAAARGTTVTHVDTQHDTTTHDTTRHNDNTQHNAQLAT